MSNEFTVDFTVENFKAWLETEDGKQAIKEADELFGLNEEEATTLPLQLMELIMSLAERDLLADNGREIGNTKNCRLAKQSLN